MKKTGLILSIIGVLVVASIATLAIVFGGSDLSGYNYVRISVNPKIEFVCDGETVIGCNAINEEAAELCCQEDFINKNIEEACSTFVDLCCRAGYIDVDKSDNAVKIDCVSGLSQSLEVKVYNVIQGYLKDNEILGAVLESANDNETVQAAKDEKVGVDKYTLIQSLLNLDSSKTLSECKGLTDSQLIELINNAIQLKGNPATDYTEEELTNKRVLLDINRVKFAKHVESITDESKAEFNKIYTRNQNALRKEVQQSFDTAYDVWKNNHINFVS